MSTPRRILPGAGLLLLAAAAVPATALAAVQQAMTPNGGDKSVPAVAPRDPGHTGVGSNDQNRATGTVQGIDRRLLDEEKTRPTLPNQAPSPSQTLPGGTASANPPH